MASGIKMPDKVGMKFEMLTVIEMAIVAKPKAHWKCKCDCGNETIVSNSNLGRTLSCGCVWDKAVKKEMIGKSFGRLIVLSQEESNKYGKAIFAKYRCKCDCGGEVVTLGMSLRNGDTTSCGCALRESGIVNGLASFKDLSGQRFGRLLVIRRVHRNQIGNAKFLCKCDCGNDTTALGNSMSCGNTTSCGCAKNGTRGVAARKKSRLSSLRRRAKYYCVYRPYDLEFLNLIEEEAVELCFSRFNSTNRNWEIDHIVPLQGLKDSDGNRLVQGFHNEFNMRVILSNENSSKRNWHWPDMP